MFAKKKIKKGQGCEEDLPDEKDTKAWEGKVYVNEIPLQGAAGAVGLAHHWALAVDFNAFWITLEGTEHEGKLVPIYQKMWDKPSEGRITKISDLRTLIKRREHVTKILAPGMNVMNYLVSMASSTPTVKISPASLRDIAANNCHNHCDYSLMYRDCQTWASEAAYQIYEKCFGQTVVQFC